MAASPASASTPARIWEEDVGKIPIFDRTAAWIFNRAGVPLLENCFRPDITSADMAYEYLNALKDIFDPRRRERLRHGKRHGALRREYFCSPRRPKELGAKDRDQKHEQL